MARRQSLTIAAAGVALLLEWAGGTAARAQEPKFECPFASGKKKYTRAKCCKEGFKRAVREYDRRSWDQVPALMLEALQPWCSVNPDDPDYIIVPYGRWRYKYVPAAYLGTAIGLDPKLREELPSCAEVDDRCAERIRTRQRNNGGDVVRAAVWWQCMASERKPGEIGASGRFVGSRDPAGLVNEEHCSEIVSVFTQVFRDDPRIAQCKAMVKLLDEGGKLCLDLQAPP